MLFCARLLYDFVGPPALLEALALPADVFLQEVQSLHVAVVEGEGAAPEPAIDIHSLVAGDDLCLACEVHRGDANRRAVLGRDLVNDTGPGHVVEQL